MTAEVASASEFVSPAMALRLDNRPHAVTLVRAALSALAERLEIDAELLDDMKTSISEACNNVVMHAYPGGDAGALTFELFLSEDAVTAVVRDHGIGLDIRAVDSGGGPEPVGGVGIPVIRALTSEAQFDQPAGGGTAVRMTFAAMRDGISLLGAGTPASAVLAGEPGDGGDVAGSVSPVTLLPPVLGRLARALAAGARFSLDRFSDVYLVTDAVGALLDSDAAGDRVRFELVGRDRRLELRIGPLAQGSTERVRDRATSGARPSPLVSLTDSLEAAGGPDDTEELRIVLVDRREPG